MVCFVNPLRRPHINITFFAVLARRVGSPSMMVPFGARGSRARPDGASLARRAAGRFAARSRRAARSQRLDRVPSAATRRPMADGGRHAITPPEAAQQRAAGGAAARSSLRPMAWLAPGGRARAPREGCLAAARWPRLAPQGADRDGAAD